MEQKKHYLVYKTTNLVNGKIYIGQHQTYDLNDGYLGSGILLKRAIEKYGAENFKREILFECSSVEEMNAKEAELVNEEFLKRDDVYNLKEGGEGGWDFINQTGKNTVGLTRVNALGENNKAGQCYRVKELLNESSEYAEAFKRKISDGLKRFMRNHPGFNSGESNGMFGKKHSEITRKKLSNAARRNNFMSGKCWIRNPMTRTSKVWDKSLPIPEGWERGRFQPNK